MDEMLALQHEGLDAALATLMIHSDDSLRTGPSVASDMSLSTTFRHPTPPADQSDAEFDPSRHVYSRYSQPTLARAEKLLSTLLGGPAMLFSSGLGAAMAALMYLKPKTVAITKGYHGVHEVLHVYQEIANLSIIALEDEYPEGTLCWLETPLNPVGEARDIQLYADKVHKVGGKLIIDATFAPPPLQAPFDHGADCIMHSATKYFFGHSDALGGALAVRTQEEWQKIWRVRTFGGACPGSLETWLLLRSLRTLTVRVEKQAKTATQLALWLNDIASSTEAYDGCPAGVLARVHHARLQALDPKAFNAFQGPKPQLKNGPACFSIVFRNAEHAKWFPFELQFFVPATSLGGVESLVEQRIVSDPGEDPCLVRLSIGLEDVEDLKKDMRRAFNAVAKQ